jgi:GNAT superfamily N-acetyltransferase
MLRLAKEKDHAVVKALCKKFFQETEYAHLSVDDTYVDELITAFLVEDKTRVVLLWEPNGEVHGILAGQLHHVPFLNRKVAMECMWWVDPEARGSQAGPQLLDAFEYWADLQGADILQMMSMPNRIGKALDRYYKKRGYKLTELTYTKEL